MTFLPRIRHSFISVWHVRFNPILIPEMKKQARHISKLQKYKDKTDYREVSGTCDLHVVCTGGSSKCVVLRTNHDKYMFNCGETTMKSFNTILSSVHATDNIFFTYNSWSNLGGLIGSLITMNTNIMKKHPVTIHGPPHVEKVLGMCNQFSQVEAMSDKVLSIFKVRGVDEGPFEDSQVTVEYVKLTCNQSTISSETTANQSNPGSETTANQSNPGSETTANKSSPGSETVANQSASSSEIKATLTSPGSEKTEDQSAHTTEMSTNHSTDRTENEEAAMEEENIEKYAVAYIVTLAKRNRKMDNSKIKELKIPKGPWLRDLTLLKTVTLDDGRVIQPDDVLLPHVDDSRPFIVLECPRKDFLDSLLSSQQFLDLASDPGRRPFLMMHMSPADVVADQRYKTFMDRYSPGAQHIMMNEECPQSVSPKTLQLQSSLHYVHSEMFPLLTNHNLRHLHLPTASTKGDIVTASFGLQYNMRPASMRGLQWYEPVFGSDLENHVDLAREKNLSGFDEDYSKMRQKLESLEKLTSTKDPARDYPEIVFLGTGSAEPSIRRNASAILVQMKQDEFMLLDCGEGTLTQLHQMYGKHVDHVLSNLKAIFISHLHYDHHGGVFNVAEARYKALQYQGKDESLHLIAPSQYRNWIQLYDRYMKEGDGSMVLHTLEGIRHQMKVGEEIDMFKELKKLLALTELNCVPVPHARHSHAVVLEHTDGWKLVYSGDTRPCDALVKAGKGCDILIHEGTFDDEALDNAISTKHCTTGEAIDIGKAMGAKFTLLTHFSQRIHYIPALTSNFTENVGFSFDFMKIKQSQLKQIPLLKPMLSRLFAIDNGYDDNEDEVENADRDNPSQKKRKQKKNKQAANKRLKNSNKAEDSSEKCEGQVKDLT